ncbi:MAG: hypothetical protein CSA45_06005 [Gammaproteobacteria bacterium]|nr:MAG: hypothetical protein CSA45_06005 [Gammaproteobacteria bacterium]
MAKKSTLNINDLSTWTIPVVVIFVVAIIAIIGYLIKMFLVDDVTKQIHGIDTKIIKQEQTYAKNQEIIALLPHIRKEVSELLIVRDEAKKFLPTEVSMPALIDNVYLAARDNGIVFDKFTPEKDIDTEFYTIKPIALSAEVGYESMASFIEQVTTLKRIMNVQSVSFDAKQTTDQEAPRSANDPLEMTAQLRTYIFKDDEHIDPKKK